MLTLRSGTIDDTVKPAIEWIDGRAVQKLMPTDFHAFIQAAFLRVLYAWAKVTTNGRGKVGTEWRFDPPENGYGIDSVVPDVSYLAGYFDLPKAERRYPPIPPDIVVEVRSPDDEDGKVARKRAFYLWWGVKLVIIADPERRTVETHESTGSVSHFGEYDVLESRAFPTLAIPLRDVFAEIDDRD